MLKILNILVDDKFIDALIEVFEATKGEHKHDYIIISNKEKKKLQYITKTEYIKQVDSKDLLTFINNKEYNLVILHSLSCIPWFKINQIDKRIKILWKAWGFDLYRTPNEIQPFIKLRRLQPITKKYWRKHYKKRIYTNFKVWVYDQIHKKEIKQAINRIDYFSGCLPIEYDFIKEYKSFRAQHLELPYFALKSKYTKKESLEFPELGSNILIGNSGAIANNHFDIFNRFSTIKIEYKKVIVPLSYGGDDFYIKDIVNYGKKIFGKNFFPVRNFMSLTDYFSLLSTCSHAIFGYEQQAALGNAFELLWAGVKLFLPQSSVNYKYFKEKGCHVFTIENDLIDLHLFTPLTIEEKKLNREILLRLNSKEVNLLKIKNIYQTIEKK